MFEIFDNFKAYDENHQPYTFSVERHTETANLHAGVTEEGFSLKSIGNRHILNSPVFLKCEFKMNFKITYPFEIDPEFIIAFGYDEKTRTGMAFRIKYDTSGKLCVDLIKVKNSLYERISDTKSVSWHMPENDFLRLNLKIDPDSVSCEIDGMNFSFACRNKPGKIAIERKNFIGELIIKNFRFCTDDEFEKNTVISTAKINVPMTNGGDVPYTVQYRVDKVQNEYYMTAVLDGGARSKPVNREERVGQYVAGRDYMTSPYAGLTNGEGDVIFNMANGVSCFVDPNIYWDCQKLFFGDTPLPIANCYKITGFVPDENTSLIFGYENLSCKGYEPQEGAREFVFSKSGQLLYNGASRNSDSAEVFSPFDKKAISLIPEDCKDKEQVINHLKYNHYFTDSEDISFTFKYRTDISPEYLSVKAEIENVFETETLCKKRPEITTCSFYKSRREISAHVSFPPMDAGVYKIVFTVFYGENEYKRLSYAFEVFKPYSGICPPLESGLPFMFTMNNELKKIKRNGFDLWNPYPSDNVGHYIACATNTPVEAEEVEVWKYLKIFGRTWFAWLAIRTCNDYLSPVHDITIKNADYLFHTGKNTDCDPLGAYSIFPNRIDHWCKQFYRYDEVKQWVSEFEAENPIGDRMALIDYINDKGQAYTKNHNIELKKLNPKVKRAIYGPLPAYFSPTLTHHSLKYFGIPENDDLADEYFSGFAVYEDYPFSCSYQTYRGPFAIMTILLNVPRFTVYPELYSGSNGGCIDGAVKFAHAPMGAYECSADQNSTVAFEYVFNTAHKTAEGFKYWSTYGFHRGSDTNEYIDKFVKNWHYVQEHKPVRPLRSIAYIVDYSGDADVLRPECSFYNQSESGQTIVYECARESGVPGGFGIKPENLNTLTENDCDVLVIPSLYGAEREYAENIRRLYNAGVNLIALSDVTGLEDIFGVEKRKASETVKSVEYGGKTEYVYNSEADFEYKPKKANVSVTANGKIPAVITTERTALINTALISLGCADKEKMTESKAGFITGTLIREALTDEVKRLSKPLVYGENIGVTLFEDKNGSTMLLAIDYSPFDNVERGEKEAAVKINLPGITGVLSDIPVKTAKKDGAVREIRFNIKPHGFSFIKLIAAGEKEGKL